MADRDVKVAMWAAVVSAAAAVAMLVAYVWISSAEPEQPTPKPIAIFLSDSSGVPTPDHRLLFADERTFAASLTGLVLLPADRAGQRASVRSPALVEVCSFTVPNRPGDTHRVVIPGAVQRDC